MRDRPMRKTRYANTLVLSALIAAGTIAMACQKKEQPPSKPSEASAPAKPDGPSKGVGPISSVTLGEIDPSLAAQGEKTFSGTCSACHKLDQRYVGPALAGVTKRRSPEWIMNMIMNPTGMTQEDPTAKALLGEYMTQMSVNATEADARALLEYFRKLDG
jgi:mono/diheme cytochrome c family protein